MSLLDRIEHIDGVIPMNNHLFPAVIFMLDRGEMTRAQAITALDIQPSEEARFDDYKTFYDTLSATDQQFFFALVTSANTALEHDKITQAKYKTFFGMT